MLDGRNNRFFFPWEQMFFLMQMIFIVLPSNMAAVQNLYNVNKKKIAFGDTFTMFKFDRLGATLLNTTKQPQINSNDTFLFLILQLALINACLWCFILWIAWRRINPFLAFRNFFLQTNNQGQQRFNRPFYSCMPCYLAFEWKWGWKWPCYDRNLTSFVM